VLRFLHSADWQLGARFRQFGERAEALRAARLDTLRRTLDLARERAADAFLIAGDLFEDNLVDERLVAEVADLFARAAPLPILILPGNHDPFTGPGCVWTRRAFAQAPSHVQVFRSAEAVERAGAVWIGAPLRQRQSPHDPSLALAPLAAPHADRIRIGITHGSPAIPSLHQPNDHPIQLEAATRAGLDYLALGHWHSWQADFDGGRMVMPGTPEPEQFDAPLAGRVAWVEIAAPGAPPQVTPLRVASLAWHHLRLDWVDPAAVRAAVQSFFASPPQPLGRMVVRVTLTGRAPATERETMLAELRARLDACHTSLLVDESQPELSPLELATLRAERPALAGALEDLNCLLASIGGAPPAAKPTAPAWSGPRLQALVDELNLNLSDLTPELLLQARRLLLAEPKEGGP
jgi:DNA repair exonuclease SbcCD nuclease subunit